jgi:hypothetical protein
MRTPRYSYSKSHQLKAYRPDIDCFLVNFKSIWQQAYHAKAEFLKEPDSAFTSERDLDLELLQVIGGIEQDFSKETAANSSPPVFFPDVEVSNAPTMSALRLCIRNLRCDPDQKCTVPCAERPALFQFLFDFCKRTR